MLLYLLRHADAETFAISDAKRELTSKGQLQAVRVGQFCRRQQLVPEIILTSPYERAKQTASLVAKEIEGPEMEIAPFLASGMRPQTALAELSKHAKRPSLMIVGHEPDLGHLAAELLGGPASLLFVRKASLTLIELPESPKSPFAGNGLLHFSIPVEFMQP